VEARGQSVSGQSVSGQSVSGWTAPGFEGVRDAFERNFADDLETGACFAAFRRDELVVDLWGGLADPRTDRPWERDTLALVFSTTKGITAMCANRLAETGALDLTAPVVDVWPEFAAAGKAGITVAQLLTHEAGLAWVDTPLALEQALDWTPMVDALAAQAPHWEPGSAHGYHAVTYGYLVGEVIRRATGRSVGTYLRDEIAGPLGLDFWIGLPEEHEPRVARLVGSGRDRGGERTDAVGALERMFGPDANIVKALTAGGSFADPGLWNTRAVHAAEIPSAAGIGDARSVARGYAACIGAVDGFRMFGDARQREASRQHTTGNDVVLLDLDLQFGLGFIVPSTLVTLGRQGSFGHFGLGGSMGWADPEAELAFGYVMNRLAVGVTGDQRSYRLVRACYDALDRV
jgi:CubicO group peptidase (beta-lactamase class C family)